jgi:hypothetical protein
VESPGHTTIRPHGGLSGGINKSLTAGSRGQQHQYNPKHTVGIHRCKETIDRTEESPALSSPRPERQHTNEWRILQYNKRARGWFHRCDNRSARRGLRHLLPPLQEWIFEPPRVRNILCFREEERLRRGRSTRATGAAERIIENDTSPWESNGR